jgi:hypothetical protein
MVELADVLDRIKPRMRKILLCAEASLSPEAYKPFRKLVLDEFGNSGLVKDLQGLYKSERQKSR